MQYHKQKFLHDPDNGVYGDCARTALACLLDMEPEYVPHFMYGSPPVEEFNCRRNAWLRAQGLGIVQFAIVADSLEDVVHNLGPNWMPGLRYMLSGRSPRGTNHVVVVEGDKIHDPAIPGGDLVGPCDDNYWWIEVLVPLSIHGL